MRWGENGTQLKKRVLLKAAIQVEPSCRTYQEERSYSSAAYVWKSRFCLKSNLSLRLRRLREILLRGFSSTTITLLWDPKLGKCSLFVM